MAGPTTGKHVFYDGVITVNGVTLSDHANKFTLTVGAESFVGNVFGDSQKYELPGLTTISDIAAEFFHDFAAAKVYATLLAIWQAQTPAVSVNLVLKASSAANSATNPQWTIPVFIKSMPIFDGQHGQVHKCAVTFGVMGTYSIATS